MVTMEQSIERIAVSDLLPVTTEKRSFGWRIDQICAVSLPDCYELSYSFAKEYHFVNYRLVIGREEEVPSITSIYSCAALYENEISELFGVHIVHSKLDAHGTLYRLDVETPFR